MKVKKIVGCAVAAAAYAVSAFLLSAGCALRTFAEMKDIHGNTVSNTTSFADVNGETGTVGDFLAVGALPSAWTNGTALVAGNGASVSNPVAVALGNDCVAGATNSVAVGMGSIVSGRLSSALGIGNFVSGVGSSALGRWNNVSGESAAAIGFWNTASGESAAAIGCWQNKATNKYSSAVGYYNVAGGLVSSAIGGGNKAFGSQSSAIGRSNTANGTNSTAIGYQAYTGTEPKWTGSLAFSQTPDNIYLGSSRGDKGETARTLQYYLDKKADAVEKKYALFIIPVTEEFPDFELKASTNNFSGADWNDRSLFYCSTAYNDGGLGAKGGDHFRLYVCYTKLNSDGEGRRWRRIKNTLDEGIGDFDLAPTALAVIVDPALLTGSNGSEWLSDANDELTWSYVRVRTDGPELEDENNEALWRWFPTMPVRWYSKLPKWADQEPYQQ